LNFRSSFRAPQARQARRIGAPHIRSSSQLISIPCYSGNVILQTFSPLFPAAGCSSSWLRPFAVRADQPTQALGRYDDPTPHPNGSQPTFLDQIFKGPARQARGFACLLHRISESLSWNLLDHSRSLKVFASPCVSLPCAREYRIKPSGCQGHLIPRFRHLGSPKPASRTERTVADTVRRSVRIFSDGLLFGSGCGFRRIGAEL
jgi:hypothetical protein